MGAKRGVGRGGPNAVAALTHPAENKACFKEKSHIIYSLTCQQGHTYQRVKKIKPPQFTDKRVHNESQTRKQVLQTEYVQASITSSSTK